MIERGATAGEGGATLRSDEGDGPAPPIGGFLAALGDRRLARALAAIHRVPARRWTLAALAREAGLSRTVFADDFARQVSQPPLTYLTRWRMTLAGDLLVRTDLPVEAIAERVGYASTAAFSRRFKDTCGVGPGAFRRGRLAKRLEVGRDRHRGHAGRGPRQRADDGVSAREVQKVPLRNMRRINGLRA